MHYLHSINVDFYIGLDSEIFNKKMLYLKYNLLPNWIKLCERFNSQ